MNAPAFVEIPIAETRKPQDEHPIKVAKELADQIKTIADHMGVKISDYVSPLLRERVGKDYEKVLREKLATLEQRKHKR